MQTSVARRARTSILSAAALLVAIASPALALHRETPGAVPLGPEEHSPGRSWSRYFAFSSTSDLTGSGATGRQIYVFNHFNWVCQRSLDLIEQTTLDTCPNPPEPFLVQITNGIGSPDHPSVTELFPTNVAPPELPLAQWIAFDADGSFNGSTGCEASHRQVFIMEILSSFVKQLTFGCDGDSTNPTVSVHAGLIAFESTATGIAAGPPSPAGVKQIYSFFRNDAVMKKVTAGAVDSTRPMINTQGTRIAFQSAADLLGTQQDTGIQQIFWSDYDRGKHVHTVHQLTKGNAPSQHPYAVEDRAIIAFESSATDLPGAFAPGGNQIYVARVDTEPVADLPPVDQITQQSQFGSCSWPAVSPGQGDRVAFICSDDPTPLGTPGNRVYAYDITEGKLFFVSAATDVQGPIAMNMGPWFVTMSTSFDLTGQGTCGRQLFLVDYFTGPQDGNTKIGVRHFVTVPGDSVAGSEGRLVTTAGTLVGDITDRGTIDMRFEAPDLTPTETHGETKVTIPQGYARIPPIPFLGVGAICIAQTGEGEGVLDCDGGKNGGNVSVRQDHYTDDNDPRCITDGACREDDMTCHNSVLPGPHVVTCPRCTSVPGIGPRCSSGIFVNQVCENNDDCRIVPCPDENANFGMCNGPMIQDLKDPYGAGGAILNLPVSVKFSLEVGRDNLFCTDDDLYDPYFGARTEEPLLRLTTGTSFGAITEANGVPYGPELSTAAVGGPIDCTKLRAGDLSGAKLVAALPLLDMRLPNRPGITDAVFSLKLEAKPNPIDVCGVPCTADGDCNDLNACNGVETCSGGFCTGGTPVVCDDANACNGVETCNPTTGGCLSGAAPRCDDGNPCNGAETCDATLGCVAGTPLSCDDNNPCNGIESCNPLTGLCRAGVPLCDDLNPCNGKEICDPTTSTCAPGRPIECDDHNPCNGVETCDPDTAACKAGHAPCDDGNVCNGVEACDPTTGACGPPTNPLNCTSPDVCQAASCDPVRGCVLRGACDNANVCDGIETCTPVSVVVNGAQTLQAQCGPGTGLTCDDGNPCTDDSCDPLGGCQHTNNLAPCDDGNLCTLNDHCSLGTCVSTDEVVCVDDDACNGVETCDPATGGCLPGTPPICDDNNVCTDDSCSHTDGCQYVPNQNTCDDGSACTTADHCVLGICTGDNPCDDGDKCNGDEICSGAGTCSPAAAPLNCDDDNTCTDDSCDPAFGCRHVNNSNACDDGSACTPGGDQCVNGVCIGLASPCDDNNACNGVETCNPADGMCSPGVAPNCDDGVACTDDTCDPANPKGCVHTPQGTGAEAVLCILQAVEAKLSNPPALAFRSTKLQPKLMKLIMHGEQRMAKVIDGVRRPRALFGQVKKAIVLFNKRITKARGKLKIEKDYAGDLMETANPASEMLVTLIKPAAKISVANAAAEEVSAPVHIGPACDGK